jgi:hypothetical protein
MKTVYKAVIRVFPHSWGSWSTEQIPTGLALTYKIDRETVANTGYIFAFKTLPFAAGFLKMNSFLRDYGHRTMIFECQAGRYYNALSRLSFSELHSKESTEGFFVNKRYKEPVNFGDGRVYTVPDGTVLCKSLTPIREIPWGMVIYILEM